MIINQQKKYFTRTLLLFVTSMILCAVLSVSASAASKVKLNKSSLSLKVGETYTLKLSGTTKSVKWSSTKTSVAKVSSKGKVTAVGSGTATVRAKVGSKTYSCKVTVAKVTLNKTSLSLTMGKTSTLKLSGTTKSVKWSSSKTSVAKVSSTGKVTAVFPGTATIKATSGGQTYSCKVTVTNVNTKTSKLTFKTTDGGMFILGTSTSRITFKLKKSSANVVVSVKKSSGTTVYKKTYKNCASGKTYTIDWKPSGIAAGTYHVEVKAGTSVSKSDNLILRKNEFAGGTGSSKNPFLVKTFAQLKKVEKYNGYYFKQTADINCGYATFAGMFSDSAPFTGTYNGNGKTISNLFLANTSADHVALFDVVDASGVIKNLKLSGINVTGNKLAAVLVRKNCGKVTNCTVDKCSVSSSLSSGDVFNGTVVQENAAGATVTDCTVTNSTVSASGGWNHIWSGGIVGHNNGNMMDCTIKSSIVSTTSRSYGWTHGGGLAAYNGGNMINCQADGVMIEAQTGGSCEWSGGIASENTGYISGCSFLNGTAANTGVELQNGTYVA